ncbi:MAG: hypothetical protein ACRD96_08035, partial [Bryobacteraceae bacterium]
NPTAEGALTVAGTAVLDAPGCRIMVNSNHPESITANGGACINAGEIGYVPDGSLVTNGGNCVNPAPTGYAIPQPDPYASLPEPDPGLLGLLPINLPVITSLNSLVLTPLVPGYYPGGVKITGGNVVFLPGLYIVDGLEISGDATATGNGVTIFNTGEGLKNITIAGGVHAEFHAPTSGIYENILFFNSRSAPDAPPYGATIIGTSGSIFDGVLYFPTVNLTFGGNQSASAPWARIVADTVTLAGNPQVGVDYVPPGGRDPDSYRVVTVE